MKEFLNLGLVFLWNDFDYDFVHIFLIDHDVLCRLDLGTRRSLMRQLLSVSGTQIGQIFWLTWDRHQISCYDYDQRDFFWLAY